MAPLTVADLQIDALHQEIHQGTREVRLTPGEHIVLYTLVVHAGSVVTFRDLAEALGRGSLPIRSNTLARHIVGLRRKLRDDYLRPHYIETITGIGYRFVVV